MKRSFSRNAVVALAAAVALIAAASHLPAQEKAVPNPVVKDPAGAKGPVAVVAIASVDEVLGDVAYLTESAGQGDFGKMLALLSGGYTMGLDKKRPVGMIVTLQNDEPKALAFLPVKDLDTVLAGLEEQIGKPRDAGNGILELGGAAGNPIFIKEDQGWAYVSQKANDLAKMPQFDPSAVLGDLTENYTVAVRINVGNVPADAKKVVIAQIKANFEQQLQNQLEQQPEDQREITERYMRTAIQQITSLIEDTDRVTLGLQVDGQAQTTHLDLAVIARPDTELARKMALLTDTRSSHAGFLAPDAAVNVHLARRIAQEDIAMYQDILKTGRENALKEIAEDEDIETEEARQIARDVINSLFEVAQETVTAGKIDGGAALFLSPEGKANFVAGAALQDVARLEETFKKLVEAAKNEPKAPQVAFDADQHAGVRFHTLSLPIEAKEEEARKLFGERLDVAIGFGPESVYAAFGPDGIATAKSIIDASQAKRSETTPPGQFVVALGPILKFASAMKDDPMTAALAATLEQNRGQDHISLASESVEHGVRYRLEVEQGVLQLIGAAIKMTHQNQQGPGGF